MQNEKVKKPKPEKSELRLLKKQINQLSAGLNEMEELITGLKEKIENAELTPEIARETENAVNRTFLVTAAWLDELQKTMSRMSNRLLEMDEKVEQKLDL